MFSLGINGGSWMFSLGINLINHLFSQNGIRLLTSNVLICSMGTCVTASSPLAQLIHDYSFLMV